VELLLDKHITSNHIGEGRAEVLIHPWSTTECQLYQQIRHFWKPRDQ
jgi:hypothetical protein